MMKGMLSFGSISRKWVFSKIVVDFLTLLTTIIVIDRFAFIIGHVFYGTITRDLLYLTVATLVLVVFFRIALAWVSSSVAFKISAKIKLSIRDRIYSKLLEVELDYQNAYKTGALVTTTVEGVEALGVFYSQLIPQVFISVLIPLFLYFYISLFSQQIALILLLSVPLIPISVALVQRWVRRVAKMHWSTYEDLNSFYLDSMQGMTTLKVLGLIDQRTEEISRRSWDFRNRTMKVLYTNLTSILTMDLIAMLGTALGIGLSVTSFSAGLILLPVSIIIVLLSYEFYRPLRQLGSYFHFAMQGISAVKSISEFLEAPTDEQEVSASITPFVLDSTHDIEFEDVRFSYEEGNQVVLKGVSFVAESGKITSIVGRSGSGKTTITDLITSLYQPSSGKILIGNHDISEVDRDELRKQIAVIPQSPYLFHGSIRDNLLIGKSSASEDELIQACRESGILEFIQSHPDGFDAHLHERAKNISEGQIQRLAIARALLKGTPILIMDEPTSNVDAENEMKVIETLQKISKTRTTLLITHRLSTMMGSDKIYVLNDGVIIEEGKHEELLRSDTFYTKLFHDQTQGASIASLNEEGL
jgi:ATP-binding cassette subfamily C protein